jgi:RNA polymerase sigma factor (sigma-70 family)
MAASPTLAPAKARAVESVPAAEGARLLYERYYDRVFGYCLYQLGSREEAEDAAQTTFLWAFRALRRGVVPRAEDSWLFAIAKNACRARHRARGRKRQREISSDPVVLADISPAPTRQHDELVGLEDALARLPEPQRRAILLREWRGLSYREIAAELDISGAAVETLIFRARRSLAELLNGKPAPKRARRFAFDFGSLGLALKALLGGTSAKLAGGVVAAALVMSSALGGGAERPLTARGPAPVVVPSTPAQDDLFPPKTAPATAVASDQEPQHDEAKHKPKGKTTPPSSSPGAEQPASTGSSVGQQVEETIGTLPRGAQVGEALPLGAVTDVVDKTLDDVDETLDDATGLLP